MRVTNGMMVNNLMRNLNKNLSRMEKTQQQMSSGKKFVNPSDDPIGVSRSLRLNTDVATMDQYKRNADDVASWLSTSEIAVSNISDILKRAKELTVQAANETNSVAERGAIADEIEELKGQLVQIGNTSYAGSYLFSGYKTDKPLFKSDGTYDIGGNTLSAQEVIEINIGIGDKIGENFVGQRLFGLYKAGGDLDLDPSDTLIQQQIMSGSYISASTAKPLSLSGSFTLKNGTGSVSIDLTGSYTDVANIAAAINSQLDGTLLDDPHVSAEIKDNRLVFKSDNTLTVKSTGLDLEDIGLTNNQSSVSRVDSGNGSQLIAVFEQLVTDLRNDDTTGINKALSRIEVQASNVNAIRSEIGVRANRIELTTNRIEDDTLNLKELLSKNEDADLAEVIMKLKMEEYVYEASLSGGAKIIQPTLVDFIG
ncbi:MAG TPA: flagellar hook-associated protein FlgL [Negativicutes bacterium]|nr:flagellar hook-associated protein FlgL [Negativicutes bacterium]